MPRVDQRSVGARPGLSCRSQLHDAGRPASRRWPTMCRRTRSRRCSRPGLSCRRSSWCPPISSRRCSTRCRRCSSRWWPTMCRRTRSRRCSTRTLMSSRSSREPADQQQPAVLDQVQALQQPVVADHVQAHAQPAVLDQDSHVVAAAGARRSAAGGSARPQVQARCRAGWRRRPCAGARAAGGARPGLSVSSQQLAPADQRPVALDQVRKVHNSTCKLSAMENFPWPRLAARAFCKKPAPDCHHLEHQEKSPLSFE